MKCPQLSISPENEQTEPKRPRSQLPSVQKLYNRFKPAGSRNLILKNNENKNQKLSSRDPNLNYSDALSGNNKGKNKATDPPPKTVAQSIHNPNNNNDTNRKLDQILDMLSNMKKAMSDLEVRITKLECSQLAPPSPIPITPITPLPVTPTVPLPNSTSHDNKRSQMNDSSSEDNAHSGLIPINLKLQSTIKEQNSIIKDQQDQMNVMIAQLQSL